MQRYRFILLIFILYYTGIFKYSVSCAKSDELRSPTSEKFNPSNVHNNYQGPPEQNRASRGVAGSRRHLRVGDAHQVANYFLSGGPTKGHAHFRRASDCDSNNDEGNVVGMGNPISKDKTHSVENEQNSNTNLSDSIVGAPHIPMLPTLLGAAPIISNLNSLLHPAVNSLTPMTHLQPGDDLISSVLHPRLQPHITALHDIPRALVKSASLPVLGLMNAHSELGNMLHPQGPLLGNINKALPRTKLRKNTKNRLNQAIGQDSSIPDLSGFHNNNQLSNMMHPYFLTPQLQPTGYIVRYIPHNKQTSPLSQIVGSPHQQSSNSTCNIDNSKIKQNVTDNTNDQDEGMNKNEQTTEENQVENDVE
ncbi:hypothetical protein ANTQUA_LOCUS5645 [Anthophora quadrimaculata]